MNETDRIAVLIPCYNEAVTVERVVTDFKQILPNAIIYVYDNASTDNTAELARASGAIVVSEPHRGKGKVMRQMFMDIEADYYILVDGDDTYEANEALDLLQLAHTGQYDMVVGDRLQQAKQGSLTGLHLFGNKLFVLVLNSLFHGHFHDIFSGYRVMNRTFVKQVPVVARGFEVEAELTIQALERGYLVAERPIKYKARPTGSESKLNTWRDGGKILLTIFYILRDYRPMTFFSLLALIFLIPGVIAGSTVIVEFFRTGLVLRLPMAVLAVGLVLVSVFVVLTGFVISTINRRFSELEANVQKNMVNINK